MTPLVALCPDHVQGSLKSIAKSKPLLLLHRLVCDLPDNVIPTSRVSVEQYPFGDSFPNT